MTATPGFSVDGLLGHANGLRALARALLGDEHAAEDVLQDTWVAALEGPGGMCDRPAGWLHGVTRKLALKRRRGEGRRAARERLVSRPERVAAVDEGIAEREVLRSVVEAVLGLDEPYQSVVVMRYYQDLPPRAIAERQGVPVATVHSQLHRARERLRARLDSGDERGRWVPALAAVTGWQNAAPATAVGGALFGGLAMQWKVVLGAASVAVVALGAWNVAPGFVRGALDQEQAPVELAEKQETTGGGIVLHPARAEDAAQNSQRVAAPDPDAMRGVLLPSLVAAEHAYSLAGVVVDQNDLPVAGAHVFIAPLSQPLNDLGETAGDGTFAAAWRARVPAMTLTVYVLRSGFADSGLRLLDVRSGREARVRFALRRRVSGRGRGRLSSESSAGHEITPRFDMAPGPEGIARFRWPPPAEFELAFRDRFTGARIDELRSLGYGGVGRGERPVAPVRITGTLRDASGLPRSGVYLAIPGATWRTSRSGAEGRFDLPAPAGGRIAVRAGGGDFGLDETTLDITEIEPGGEVHWEPVLDREPELRGRLEGPDGELIDGWVVEWRSESGGTLWEDSTISRAGEFAIPNLPLESGTLILRDDLAHPFASHVIAGVRPGPGELELDVTNSERGHVVVTVTDRAGKPVADADVQLWQASSGRGAWMRWQPDAGHYDYGRVPAGRYRVVAGTLGRGFVEVGGILVVVGKGTDLGAVNLPEAGTLAWKVTLPEGSDGRELIWTLLRRGPALDTVVAVGTLGEPLRESPGESRRELLTRDLPPGEYLVAIEGAEFSMPPVPVRIAPGESRTVELALDTYREVTLGIAAPASAAPVRFAILDDATGAEVYAGALARSRGRIHLAPGQYRLRAHSGSRRGEATFAVGRTSPEPVEVDLR